MKISNSLPQFNKEKALIVVSGDQEAKLYTALDGEMQVYTSFKIATPKYAESEGYSDSARKGRVIKRSALYKKLEPYIDQAFKKTINAHIKRVISEKTISSVYLFAPDYMIGLILSSLDRSACDKLRMCVYGNHLKEHPNDLLIKMRAVFAESIGAMVPLKLEARKILDTCRASGQCADPNDKKQKRKKYDLKLAGVEIEQSASACGC